MDTDKRESAAPEIEKQPAEGATPAREKQASPDEYQFIRQTIKKRPLNGRKLLLRTIGVIAAAIGFGLIASFVFVMTRPVAERVVNGVEEDPRVSIPADEEPTPTPSPVVTATPEPTATPAVTPAPTGTPDDGQNSSKENTGTDTSSGNAGNTDADNAADATPGGAADATQEDAPADITLEQYRQLHLDMLDVAAEAERAMVQVAGITNEYDLFLEGHENRRQASGLVVATTDESVYILTDSSAVTDVEEIVVTFSDGSAATAESVRADGDTGLVIVRVPAQDLSEELAALLGEARLGNSFSVVRGEPVIALGNLSGAGDSVAFGTITSVANTFSVTDAEFPLLTTDIEGGSGNSSGVLVNMQGSIVGFVCPTIAGREGDAISALAISRIKPLIERLSNNESAPYAGVHGQAVSEELSAFTGIPVGLLVTGVDPDSPAMLSGIKEYDVITQVGELEISTMDHFSNALAVASPGQTIEITAQRQGADGYAEVLFQLVVERR